MPFIQLKLPMSAYRSESRLYCDIRTEADYCWLTEEIVSLAGQYCQGRIVSALEGGYDLGALSRSVETHLRALQG